MAFPKILFWPFITLKLIDLATNYKVQFGKVLYNFIHKELSLGIQNKFETVTAAACKAY